MPPLPVFFSRTARTALKRVSPKVRGHFKGLFPANVVLHVSSTGRRHSLAEKLLPKNKLTKKKRLSWASERIRQENNGVVLQFPKSNNLIHAGQQMPAQAWYSSVWYVKHTQNTVPVAASLPNLVATGQFTFPIKTAWAKKQPFFSGSDKFPGFALTHVRLPPKVTPEIYTTKDGSKDAKFIIPGITSADDLCVTLELLSELMAPAFCTASCCSSRKDGASEI